MRLITEAAVAHRYAIIESAQQYTYTNDRERRYWHSVATKMLRDHISGRRKTALAEAAILWSLNTYGNLNEAGEKVEGGDKKKDPGIFKKAMLALGKAAAATGTAMGNVTGANYARSRNWWLFGGGGAEEDQKYRDAYVAALETRNDKIETVLDKEINKFEQSLQKTHGFPTAEDKDNPGPQNVKDPEVFKKVIADWSEIYARIANAAGVEVEGFPNNDVKKGEERIPVEAANASIKKIRTILQSYDRFLFDGYSTKMTMKALSNESRKRKGQQNLTELFGFGKKKEEKQDDIGAEGRTTSSMEKLKSNLLPGVLAALGASSSAAGLISGSDWFIKLTSTLVKDPSSLPEYIENSLQMTRESGGKGLLNYFNITQGTNLTVNSPASEVAKAFGNLSGGDPVAGVKAMHDSGVLGKGVDGTTEAFAEFFNQGGTVGEALKKMGTGTHKMAGDMWQLDIGTIKTRILKSAAKEGAAKLVQSTGAAAATAAAPALFGLGVGAIGAAVTLKALRMYGAENSRASYIQAAIDMMKDIPPRKDKEEGQGTIGGGPTIDESEAGSNIINVTLHNEGTFFSYPVKKVRDGDDPSKWKVVSKVFTMPGFEVPGMIPIEIKDEEEIKKLCSEMITKAGDGSGVKDMSKLKDYELEIKDLRKEAATGPGGTGTGTGQGTGGGQGGGPGGRQRANPTAPGQGNLVRVDLTDGTPKADKPSTQRENRMRLVDYLFEAAEVRKLAPDAGREMKDKWGELSKKARSAQVMGAPEGPDFHPVEKEFYKKHEINKDDNQTVGLTPLVDTSVERGIQHIRNKARGGNVVLGFDTSTASNFMKLQIGAKQMKALLKTYAAAKNGVPSFEDYLSALEDARWRGGDEEKPALEKILKAIGMIKTGKPKRVRKKRQEPADFQREGHVNDDEMIMERWQRLAGLI